MAIIKKKPTKKTVTKKVVEKVEEIVEEVQPEVQGYVVPAFLKREPLEKDIHVADIFYRVAGNLIEMQCYRPNFESDLDMIIAGDISITTKAGSTTVISKSNSPVDWIKNLYKSNEFAGNPFIAKEVLEIYEA